MKGAYLATEALGAAAVHTTKSVVYGRSAALDTSTFTAGLVAGLVLIGGSCLGKQIVLHMDAVRFRIAVEIILAMADLLMVFGI